METAAITWFGVLVSLAIIENLLFARWNPRYFRSGIPVYRRRLKWGRTLRGREGQVEERFSRGLAMPLRSRPIGPHEFAVRDVLLEPRPWASTYTPVMHTVIQVEGQELTLIGRLNWFTFALAATMLILLVLVLVTAPHTTTTLLGGLGLVAFCTLVLGSIYWAQARRLDQVGRYLAHRH